MPANETDTWFDSARPLFDSTAYSHDGWFFGASADIPGWTGYTLGFRLVERYKSANPGETATTLVNRPASAFRVFADQ